MSPVSDHAVVRYFERIHGMHLSVRFPNASDRVRALHGCDLLGLTLDEARDLVCPPRLHAGVSIGTGLVKADDRVLRIVEGRVVTCLRPDPRPRMTRPQALRVQA